MPLRQVRTVRHFVGTGLFNFIQPNLTPSNGLHCFFFFLPSLNVIFLEINHTNRPAIAPRTVCLETCPEPTAAGLELPVLPSRYHAAFTSVFFDGLRRDELHLSHLSGRLHNAQASRSSSTGSDGARRIGSSDSKRSGSYNRNCRKLRLRTAWGRALKINR